MGFFWTNIIKQSHFYFKRQKFSPKAVQNINDSEMYCINICVTTMKYHIYVNIGLSAYLELSIRSDLLNHEVGPLNLNLKID